ncbi:hypothetical protein C7G68_19050, partial [Acinetobacter baumannii]
MDMALYLQSAWKFGLMAWVAEQNGCNETFSCDALRGPLVPKGDRCSINMLANTNTTKIRTKRPRDPISKVLTTRQLRVPRLSLEPL